MSFVDCFSLFLCGLFCCCYCGCWYLSPRRLACAPLRGEGGCTTRERTDPQSGAVVGVKRPLVALGRKGLRGGQGDWGGKSQPARGRRRLLGTRIFRGVGPAPERAYLARVAQAELRGLCAGPSAPGASPGHVYHPRVRSVISCLRSARSIRKNTDFGGFSENLGWSCPWVF